MTDRDVFWAGLPKYLTGHKVILTVLMTCHAPPNVTVLRMPSSSESLFLPLTKRLAFRMGRTTYILPQNCTQGRRQPPKLLSCRLWRQFHVLPWIAMLAAIAMYLLSPETLVLEHTTDLLLQSHVQGRRQPPTQKLLSVTTPMSLDCHACHDCHAWCT